MNLYSKLLNSIAIGAISISVAAAQNAQTGQGSASSSGSGAQATGSHQGHGSAGSAAGAATVGKQDHTFMMEAARGGMMEVQVAQLAQQKAQSDEIKEYARKLEQDHSKANDQLKQIAQERNVQLPTDLGPHAAQLSKFQNLSGDQFDREWIRMQVQHHRKDVSNFRKQANRGMDSDLKNFASSTLPVLEQHLSEAQRLQSSTGTRSRSAGK